MATASLIQSEGPLKPPRTRVGTAAPDHGAEFVVRLPRRGVYAEPGPVRVPTDGPAAR